MGVDLHYRPSPLITPTSIQAALRLTARVSCAEYTRCWAVGRRSTAFIERGPVSVVCPSNQQHSPPTASLTHIESYRFFDRQPSQ
jgi:hypothetical protein